MQALQINAETWDRLLAPLGGEMPQHEHELGALMDRIRRVFHLREGRLHANHHQGAMGDAGNFYTGGYFPVFGNDDGSPQAAPMPHIPSEAYMTGGPIIPDPWYGQSTSPVMRTNACGSTENPWSNWVGTDGNAASYHQSEQSSMSCPTCGGGAYFQDETGSTDTSTDYDDYGTSTDGLDPSEAYQEYAFARRRWRRVSNKYPRRYRKFRRFGKGKGSKSSGSGGYAAFLPPNAFAGGKGGKSSKGGSRKNPRDKSGQIMKCNVCGSDEHLWRRCPNKPKDGNSAYQTATSNVFHGPGQGQLALVTQRPTVWGSTAAGAASLPGVHFFGSEMENLRSVSQASSTSSRKRASQTSADEPSPPTWSPGNPPADSPSASGVNDPRVTPLIEGAAAPACPPPNAAPRLPPKMPRRESDTDHRSACAGIPRATGSVSSPSVVSRAQSMPAGFNSSRNYKPLETKT